MQQAVGVLSAATNWVVERVIAGLTLILVIDVWIGVLDRYLFHWQLPWPEVIARYLMIWMALLAISAGIARREHIGLTALTGKIPRTWRRPLLIFVELIGFAVFTAIAYYGIEFAEKGGRKHAHVFGMSLFWPYMALPMSMALAAWQSLLALLRDLGDYAEFEAAEYIE